MAQQRTQQGYDTGRRFDQGYDVDEAALTRREEELQVDTHREETGIVRLRKSVTTEQKTITVQVEKEHVVVEREPASGTTTSSTGEIGEETAQMWFRSSDAGVVVAGRRTPASGQLEPPPFAHRSPRRL